MSKEALKLALVALDIVKIHYTQNRHVNEAITAIKEALRSSPNGEAKPEQPKEKAPPEQWSERWYGSGAERGWWIGCGRERIAHLGPSEFAEIAARKIVDAHNRYKLPAQPKEPEPKCNPHPKAPHGFDRNASHANDRYVCECEGWNAYDAGYEDGVIAGIEASMEQESEQEPVAWAEFDGEGGYHFRAYEDNEDYAEQWGKRNPNHVGWVKPLYTTPPQRKPLTDEQFQAIKDSLSRQEGWDGEGWAGESWDLALKKAIEAAHNIKE